MTVTPHPHSHAHHHHPPPDESESHSHQEPDGADFEAANKDFFDAEAHRYDERHDAQRRAEVIGSAMKATGLFQPGVTTVMDYACGTGLISRVLAAQDPKVIVGVDISQAMVDRFNKTVSDHGIPPEEMCAVCVSTQGKRLEGLGDMTFDVIVCAAAYHHFPFIDEVTETLVGYLNPGGSLLVADIIHGESTHEIFTEDAHHIVPHRGGFTEEAIRSCFEKAGLKNVTFNDIAQARQFGHPVVLFLARGDK